MTPPLIIIAGGNWNNHFNYKLFDSIQIKYENITWKTATRSVMPLISCLDAALTPMTKALSNSIRFRDNNKIRHFDKINFDLKYIFNWSIEQYFTIRCICCRCFSITVRFRDYWIASKSQSVSRVTIKYFYCSKVWSFSKPTETIEQQRSESLNTFKY